MSSGQSRRASFLEAVTNTVVGYGLAVLTQMVIFPVYGITVDLAAHLGIAVVFVAVSILRSYVLRRIFERWR